MSSIQEIIAAAPTTSTTTPTELTNGTTEAILTFSTRRAAALVLAQLEDAGAEVRTTKVTAYGEYILVATYPTTPAPVTWSVMANEAGNEATTTEVLYSGLTKAVAYSTARTLWEQYSEEETINYYIQKDAK
jgi:hypothetical protein